MKQASKLVVVASFSFGFAAFFLVNIFVFSHATPAVAMESKAVKGAKEDLKSVKAELNAKLEAADKELADAKAKGKQLTEKTVKELEENRDKVKKQIESLNDDGKQSWKKVKKSIVDAVDGFAAKVRETLKD